MTTWLVDTSIRIHNYYNNQYNYYWPDKLEIEINDVCAHVKIDRRHNNH